MGASSLTRIGIILFSAVVLFQLITLPVEFDASKRALVLLENKGILYKEEVNGAKKSFKCSGYDICSSGVNGYITITKTYSFKQQTK